MRFELLVGDWPSPVAVKCLEDPFLNEGCMPGRLKLDLYFLFFHYIYILY